LPAATLKVDTVATKTDPAVPATAAPRRRHMSPSISPGPLPTLVAPPPTPSADPLTIQQLQAYWQQMVEALRPDLPHLAEQLADRQLQIEDDDRFVIIVNNSYLDAEIRPHLIRMLTLLRRDSQHPLLNCRVQVVYPEHQAVPYTARDKYDTMLQQNPMLDNFKVLFPEVDL